ncbi:hypothetical protein ASG19_10000 [Rhizobium sp. Leaf306]|nr:hypothetical protein ASG19_10000 [Rhizobium sp. Leaf306]
MKGLRKWRWGELPTYNGFTHAERVRGWQAIHFLIDNGWAQRSNICCISGDTNMPRLHSETYYSWEPYTISHSIHMALHQRFRQPAPWRRIVDRYSVDGAEWYARLSLEPVDLAAQLRADYGPEITDLFARVPVPVGTIIPHHQIYRQE